MSKIGYVYILGNQKPVLYIGVTANPLVRIYRHKHGVGSLFTKKYNIHKLLYIEKFESIWEAIKREKQIKNWRREWKINLIRSKNPNLDDLYVNLFKLNRDMKRRS